VGKVLNLPEVALDAGPTWWERAAAEAICKPRQLWIVVEDGNACLFGDWEAIDRTEELLSMALYFQHFAVLP
jgi:hypothetical protein